MVCHVDRLEGEDVFVDNEMTRRAFGAGLPGVVESEERVVWHQRPVPPRGEDGDASFSGRQAGSGGGVDHHGREVD